MDVIRKVLILIVFSCSCIQGRHLKNMESDARTRWVPVTLSLRADTPSSTQPANQVVTSGTVKLTPSASIGIVDEHIEHTPREIAVNRGVVLEHNHGIRESQGENENIQHGENTKTVSIVKAQEDASHVHQDTSDNTERDRNTHNEEHMDTHSESEDDTSVSSESVDTLAATSDPHGVGVSVNVHSTRTDVEIKHNSNVPNLHPVEVAPSHSPAINNHGIDAKTVSTESTSEEKETHAATNVETHRRNVDSDHTIEDSQESHSQNVDTGIKSEPVIVASDHFTERVNRVAITPSPPTTTEVSSNIHKEMKSHARESHTLESTGTGNNSLGKNEVQKVLDIAAENAANGMTAVVDSSKMDEKLSELERAPEDVDPLNIFVDDIKYQRFPKAMSLDDLKEEVLGHRYKKLYIMEESKKKIFENIRQLEAKYELEDDILYVSFTFRYIVSRTCDEIKKFKLGKLSGQDGKATFEKQLKDGRTERIVFFSENPKDYIFFLSCSDMNESPYACRDSYYLTMDSNDDPPNHFPWGQAAQDLQDQMHLTFDDKRFYFNFVMSPCAKEKKKKKKKKRG